jgi:signal transduction histidine kinase
VAGDALGAAIPTDLVAAALSEISEVTAGELSVRHTMGAVVAATRRLADVDIAAILAFDGRSERVWVEAAHGHRLPEFERLTATEPERGMLREALAGRRVVVAGDYRDLAPERRLRHPALDLEPAVTAAFLPLLTEVEPQLVLAAFRRTARPFSAGDLDLLRLLAAHATIAVDHALKSEELERLRVRSATAHVEGLTALTEVSRHLEHAGRPNELLAALSATVARLVSARRAAFWLLQPDQTLAADAAAAHGFDAPLLEAIRPPCQAGGGNLFERIVYGDEIFRGLSGNDHDAALARSWLDALGARECIAVPLRAGDRRLGALAVYDSLRPGGFQEEDVWVLQVAAHAATMVWRQRQLTDTLVAVEQAEAIKARAHAERMAALEEAKSHVLRVASHELRSPLAIIQGYLQMLEDGTIHTMDVLRRVLPPLLSRANHMSMLVTEMLETARLEEGQLQLDLGEHDLREIVDDAVRTMRPLASMGHELTLVEEPHPVPVLADHRRIKTVLTNLIDNAIKYSPNGGSIEVRVSRQQEAAVVSVTDHGLGIAPEDQGQLFQRFGRIVTKRNSHVLGTGLGLYLGRQLALAHGGDITVDSEPGRGSTFSLVLPVAEAPSSGRGEGEPIYDLTRFDVRQMIRCGADLLRAGQEARTVEEAAASVVGRLHRGLVDAEGRPALPLVRMFKTHAYGELAIDLQRAARACAGEASLRPDTVCLVLLASAGDEPDWNVPAASVGHRCIPLTDAALSARAPAVGHLLKLMQADAGRPARPERVPAFGPAPQTHGVYHVEDALGSPDVVSQEEFVVPYGVRSVVAFGGVLSWGDRFVVLLFSRVPIPRSRATLFSGLASSVQRLLQPMRDLPPFGPSGAV